MMDQRRANTTLKLLEKVPPASIGCRQGQDHRRSPLLSGLDASGRSDDVGQDPVRGRDDRLRIE